MNKIKNTLILSGSAINGLVTLGAIQFLIDQNVINLQKINKYIGTSSGSMISLLLSVGYSPLEIFIYLSSNDVFKNVKKFDIISLIKGSGCLKFDPLLDHLEVLLLKKIDTVPTLMEIKTIYNKDLNIITYNLTKEKNYFKL